MGGCGGGGAGTGGNKQEKFGNHGGEKEGTHPGVLALFPGRDHHRPSRRTTV